jgi:hypothetical protein
MLAGCGCQEATGQNSTALRVVTQISVYYQEGPLFAQRHYRSEDKMRQVLNYLRTVNAYGAPDEDPEKASGSEFQIYLYYSDGSRKQYLQRSNRFLRVEGGTWKKIDPKKAAELSRILSTTESDQS